MATLVKEVKKQKAKTTSVLLHDPDVMKQIAQTAYYLWEKRGCPHGSDLQDWIEAEKIVTGRGRA